MKQSICASIFLAACTLLLTSQQAHAKKVPIYVTNCIKTAEIERVAKVGVYNGRDGAKLWTKTDKKINYGETKRLRCDPQGKKRCWLIAKPAHDGATATQKKKTVGKRKYAKVTVTGGKTRITVYTSKPSCP